MRQDNLGFDTKLDENCIGVAQIDPDPIIKAGNPNVKLSLQFQVRSTYWKYRVIVPSNRSAAITLGAINDPYTPSDPPIPPPPTYTNPIPKIIMGGQEAQEYTSLVQKELKQYLEEPPKLTFTYPDLSSSQIVTDEIGLPNPSAENLEEYIMPDGTKTLSATVIVYV